MGNIGRRRDRAASRDVELVPAPGEDRSPPLVLEALLGEECVDEA